MGHTIHGKKPLLARVRRIKGQAEALERALSEESECLAILQQIAAIRGAVNGLMSEVLEGHIREHLGAQEATEAQRTEDLEVVVAALRSYLK
ncbi:metal/formaldehyde-sensitive transcriptional repressor [Variovorax sp. GT1P44]|uniref:metal/formaldehyde-sensitive transcriptional repressor n=1 Tax=Variovorax sp. GT1P44 TaxID=3443742 RepID=UPI003F476EDE